MRFSYNERKAAQMAARLLRAGGGRLDVIVLMKLMYLCDRRALIERGLPITGAFMVSMRQGPVLSEVLDDINDGQRPAIFGGGGAWNEFVQDRDGYAVTVVDGATSTDELSRFETRVIDEVFAEFGGIGKWDLVRLTHELPEWRDPGRSSLPIQPEEILRSAGKAAEEIEAIVDAAEGAWFVERMVKSAS